MNHPRTSILPAIALALALFASPAWADTQEQEVDGRTWRYELQDGYATVLGASPATGDVTIPGSLGGCPVTSIGDSAFRGCRAMASVTIPDSVTSIGGYAFADCGGLTKVYIHDLAAWCGIVFHSSWSNPLLTAKHLYLNGKEITDLTIPDSVTNIGDYAFSGCSALTSVTIPEGVTSIGNTAFRACSGLTSVTIPDSVTNIGDYAFSGCNGLTNVTIFGNITNDYCGTEEYNNSPFASCTNIATLVLGGKMTKIGDSMFSGCSGLASVTIGNSLTSIGVEAFYNCSGLTSVTIPESVTSIGGSAFYNCSGLTSVTIGNGVTSIGGSAFYKCSGLTAVCIHDLAAWCGIAFDSSDSNPLSTAKHLYLNGKEITDLTIPNGVTSIGRYAFRNCSGLTSVTIPDSMTNIGDYAFCNCSGLTSMTIPEGVVDLSTTAFDGCDKLWTSWYRTLANLAAGGGGSSGGSKTVSLTVTNVVVHYVTQSVPSGAVTPGTNSTGIVNVIAEVGAGKAIAISEDWAKQYPAFEATFGGDFAAALTMETGKRDGAGNPMFVWQDYVAGTDPTDSGSVFTASLTFDAETGEPVISWSPELSPDEAAKRRYDVSGKVRMTDPDWLPVGDNAGEFNFFRVSVEMK